VSLNTTSLGETRQGPEILSARNPQTDPLCGHDQLTDGSYSARGPVKAKYTGPLWRESEKEKPQVNVAEKLGLGDPSMFKPALESLGLKAAQKFPNPREVFKYVDLNRDGCVVKSEIRHLFRAFNLPDPLANQLFDYLDVEKRNEIRFGDFVDFLWPYLAPGTLPILPDREDLDPGDLNWKPDTKEGRAINKEVREALIDIKLKMQVKFKYARQAFIAIDGNKDGRISQAEVNEFFRAFGWGHVSDNVFEMMDKDGSGVVEYSEFMNLFGEVLGPGNKMAPHRAKICVGEDKELERAINDIGKLVGVKLYSKYSNVQEAWREINMNKDGQISRAELDMFFKKMILPIESSEKVLQALDKSMDDGIERKEFVSLFGPMLPNL